MQPPAVLGSLTLAAAVAVGVLWSLQYQLWPLEAQEHPHRASACSEDATQGEGLGTRRMPIGAPTLPGPRVLVRGRIRTDFGPLVQPSLNLAEGPEPVLHPDGRFEVLGQVMGATVSYLTADARGCRQWWMDDVPVGTNDLDIVLVRVETVRALVRIDASFIEKHPPMRFDLIDGAGLRWGAEVSTDEGRWECTWEAVPLGRYRLEVRPFTAARSTIKVDEINVLADRGFAPQPREFDLRGRLRSMRLSLRDATGAPLDSDFMGQVVSLANLYRDRRGAWREVLPIDKDGCDLVVADTDGFISVRVEDDTRAATYRGPCADITLTMRPRPTSAAWVSGLRPAPEDADWCLRIAPASGEGAVLGREPGSDPLRSDLLFAFVDHAGWCRVALTPGTRYHIDLCLSAHRGSSRSTEILPVHPGSISMGDSLPHRLVFRVAPR